MNHCTISCKLNVNARHCRQESRLLDGMDDQRYYFVHSYRAMPSEQNKDWVLSTTNYGEDFISAVKRGDTYATQFHPEKSGAAGLTVLENFFKSYTGKGPAPTPSVQNLQHQQQHNLNGEAFMPCYKSERVLCQHSRLAVITMFIPGSLCHSQRGILLCAALPVLHAAHCTSVMSR